MNGILADGLNNKPDLETLSRDVEAGIREAWEKDRRERWAPSGHWASNAGHPCPFYLWAKITRWNDLPQPETSLLGIFRNGRDVEEAVTSDLREAGFEVLQSQVGFEDKRLRLRGRIDGFLRKAGHPVLDKARPIEVKSMHPAVYDSINSFRDLLDSRRPWLRKYTGQVLIYGWLTGEPLVGLVLRNKSSRATKVLWAWLEDWLDELEVIVSRLELVNKALANDDPAFPAPVGYDSDLCDLCEAAAICPAMLARQGEGTVALVDLETVDSSLDRIRELKAAAKECGSLEDRVKRTLEGAGYFPEKIGGMATLVTQRYRVTCKTGRTTRKEYPVDVQPVIVEVSRKLWEYKPLNAEAEAPAERERE